MPGIDVGPIPRCDLAIEDRLLSLKDVRYDIYRINNSILKEFILQFQRIGSFSSRNELPIEEGLVLQWKIS